MPAKGLLRYPYEAITQNTDYLQIRIFKYERKGGVTDGPKPSEGQAFDVSNYVSNKAKVLGPDGVIILPMPSNIQDSNVVSYDNDSMNTFAAQGVTAVQGLMGGGGKAFSEFVGRGKAAVGADEITLGEATPGNTNAEKVKAAFQTAVSNDAGRAISANLAVSAVNVFGANVSFNSLLARTDSKILNPNMELLFNNVTLRTFRFSFKFAPRDPNEATAVKSIIRTFKKNMAAQKEGEIFLKTPNIFKLTYRKGNQNHPFLHRFKDCALSDMSVQYTGDNVYATYSDGTPVSMIMNLTFKEMMPIYSSDYDKDDSGTAMPNQSYTSSTDEYVEGPQGNLIYGAGQNSSTDVEGVGF